MARSLIAKLFPGGSARRLAAVLAAAGFGCLGFGAATALGYSTSAAVLDSFNRADGSLGASWTCPGESGAASIVIAGGAAVGGGGTSACVWSSPASSPDEEVYATFPTQASRVGLILRENTTANFYECAFGVTAGTYSIRKVVGGTVTTVVNAAGTFAAGDSLACVADGRLITLYHGTGSPVSWTAAATALDSSVTAAGNVGLMLGGSTSSADDFGGGNYVQGSFSTTSTVTTTSVVYTGQATVTSAGGGGTVEALGGNCGGTTTDAGGATVQQDACSVVLDAGDSTKLDYIWIGLALLFGVFLIAPVTRYFNREQSGWGGGI